MKTIVLRNCCKISAKQHINFRTWIRKLIHSFNRGGKDLSSLHEILVLNKLASSPFNWFYMMPPKFWALLNVGSHSFSRMQWHFLKPLIYICLCHLKRTQFDTCYKKPLIMKMYYLQLTLFLSFTDRKVKQSLVISQCRLLRYA